MEVVVDPYKILNLKRDFTERELRDAYRTKALQVHPDKGGSHELFQVVCDCFKQLAEELKMKDGTKPLEVMKSSFADDVKKFDSNRQYLFRKDDRFDNEKFNRVFEQTKIHTAHDDGYEDFIKTYKYNNAPSIHDNSNFNSEFDNFTKNTTKSIVVKKNPEPQHLCNQHMMFEELGVDKIDDFSSGTQSALQYCDLQKACTTVRLAPEADKKRRAKTLGQLEKERDALNKKIEAGTHITEKFHQQKEKETRREQMLEAKRQNNLKSLEEKVKKQMVNILRLATAK